MLISILVSEISIYLADVKFICHFRSIRTVQSIQNFNSISLQKWMTFHVSAYTS